MLSAVGYIQCKDIYQLTLNHFLGAAGNFLAPISTLSENAFKTVLGIDTVGHLC